MIISGGFWGVRIFTHNSSQEGATELKMHHSAPRDTLSDGILSVKDFFSLWPKTMDYII